MSKYISRETVRAVMLEVARTPPNDVSYLTDQMLVEQPVIVEYLYRLSKEPFDLVEHVHFNETE
jgi:hypothetical protein